MTGQGENYRARLDAAQWSTLLAILTELRAIRALLESQGQRSSWPEQPAPVAPRMVDRPPPPRRFGDETDPGAGADGYWPSGRLTREGGAHRG